MYSVHVHVCVMALVATATRLLRFDVCEILGMPHPHVHCIVTMSPDKSNIILGVSEFDSLETTFVPVIEKVPNERVKMGRTLIFCQQQGMCAS